MIAESPVNIPSETKTGKSFFPKGHYFSPDEYEKLGCHTLPYRSRLSFEPLIDWWRERLHDPAIAGQVLAKEIISRVEATPELMGTIDDDAVLETRRDLIELMLSGMFPIARRDTLLAKVSPPFVMKSIFMTPPMEALYSNGNLKYKINGTVETLAAAMLAQAGSVILNKVYDQEVAVDPGLILTVECPRTFIQRHYKSILTTDFVRVKTVGKPQKLSPGKIEKLLSNIHDLKAWQEALPPENFEIYGLVGVEFVEVSEREILSNLKNELLRKDAVVKQENIKKLENMLRSFFLIPDLRMGLTAVDYPPERAVLHKYKIRYDFLAHRQPALLSPENAHSIYEKACRFREVVFIDDLEKMKNKTPIEKDLLDEGFRCVLVAPLFNTRDEIIGLFEIGVPRPYGLNTFAEMKFKELLPLFNLALERSREEIDNQIEAIIRERFTTIHPSVEWKFIECAFQLMEMEEKTGKRQAPMPILFEDVHPLYAQADIVSSSTIRNHAIQADFTDNLEKIRQVLRFALDRLDFPILHQYLLETEALLEGLRKELKSNDENRIMDFIKTEIHVLFEEIKDKEPDLTYTVHRYFDSLDTDYGIVYNQRKKYEDSVAQINETLSGFIEAEDSRMQKIMPHYFEKYKTDGVEYEIYAGQSILRTQKFNRIHLKNLRLWQMITMCEVTRKMDQLRDQLPVPLSTAQLVFVYNHPISVRFRMDDKHFDVDGAYNVRYEIIKKRIDKAYIDGTDKRLTQPGKIAIVYTADKDYDEYMEYLIYLRRQQLIEDNIESLTLAKLQGVHGLKALRVTVKL